MRYSSLTVISRSTVGELSIAIGSALLVSLLLLIGLEKLAFCPNTAHKVPGYHPVLLAYCYQLRIQRS